jgi:chromosomal replication initiator protein
MTKSLDKQVVENKPKEPTYFSYSKINRKLTFDNYIVGDFNREVAQAGMIVAKNPGTMFNPLFIHSNSGLGKTHLLHAIANYIQQEENPNAKILCISANDFVEEYIKFVRGDKESESLKDYICGFDVLLFDDVQFLADKVKTEEMFFNIYQRMISEGKQIIITSDKHPNELKNIEERLVTRFNQGLVMNIKEPDRDSCVSILENKIESNGMDITKFDNSVLYFFADKFSKNVRELEGALNRLIFHVLNFKDSERITMDVAAEAVQTLVGGKNIATQMNEQKIINIVAEYYSLTPDLLVGKSRTGQVALARHIAMYVIRKDLDISLEKIGEMFGGRDHTTVINAVGHVDKELTSNDQLKQAIDDIQKRINK